MGFMTLITNCCACGALVTCSPVHVPSITVNGQRQAICRDCFEQWNRIHRTSKGLEPVALHPDAYIGCNEDE